MSDAKKVADDFDGPFTEDAVGNTGLFTDVDHEIAERIYDRWTGGELGGSVAGDGKSLRYAIAHAIAVQRHSAAAALAKAEAERDEARAAQIAAETELECIDDVCSGARPVEDFEPAHGVLARAIQVAKNHDKQAASASAALAERDRLREALRVIADWRLPSSGKTWDDGSPMSYGAAFGSNGERDFMRDIAERALAASSAEGEKALKRIDRMEGGDVAVGVVGGAAQAICDNCAFEVSRRAPPTCRFPERHTKQPPDTASAEGETNPKTEADHG